MKKLPTIGYKYGELGGWQCSICGKPFKKGDKCLAILCCQDTKNPPADFERGGHGIGPVPRLQADNITQPGPGGHWYRGQKPTIKKKLADYHQTWAQIERLVAADEKKWRQFYARYFYPQQTGRKPRSSPLQALAYGFAQHNWEIVRGAAIRMAHALADAIFRQRMNDITDLFDEFDLDDPENN